MKRFYVRIIVLAAVILTLGGCANNSKESQEQANGDTVVQPAGGQTVSDDTAANETNDEAGGESSDSQEDITEDYVLKEGTIESVVYDSKAIADNLIEEKTEQALYVYLPPTYYESDKTYPVVYYLHGFGEPVATFIQIARGVLNQAFSEEPSKEFIMVAVNGKNLPGGSFYVNSPVTGKWEDYASKEVVSYIDSNYRTIANAQSRGICGFSMGGFGALNLALLHPEVYGATYAMSPGVLAPEKIGDAFVTWKSDSVFLRAYSLAFAYNTTEPYETIPLGDGSDTDNALLKRWEAGYGDWKEKLDAYLKLDTPLRAIGLSCGEGDSYAWIPEGTKYLSGLLDEKGIEHVLFTFQGGHTTPPNAVSENLLPFFREALVWE